MSILNKVVVATGGFGVLGQAVARGAAERGARVVLIDRVPEPHEPLPETLREAFVLGGVDLASTEHAQAAFASIAARFGGIDVLANIAGGFRWQTLADGDLATWDELFAINAKTAAVASKAVLPHLVARGGGRIVNVGANAAGRAAAGMGPYAASKAAVARLTESLAEETKDLGITVNAVLPSIIDTPRNRLDMPKADFSRWVAPEAVADVILFLASDRARAVTGALIPVTGRV